MLKIKFLGGVGTVTGSKFLITEDGANYLVDCGLFQGLKMLRLKNWNPLPLSPSSIKEVILTHAHIDHSGYLPLLVKNGFKGRIWSTKGTKALCDILLPDAGHLQEEDAEFANRHKFSKHHPALPLYTKAQAQQTLSFFNPVPWDKPQALSAATSIQFLPAGHILGASIVKMMDKNKCIVFSGDLGRLHDLTMKPPTFVDHADYLLVESTYGNRLHPKTNPKDTLKDLLIQTYKKGGTVLIPAFAVGRIQDVLHLLAQLKNEKEIPDIPVYLNTPMGSKATALFSDFMGEHALSADECHRLQKVAHMIETVDESKALNQVKKPAIIISASGMATGGRVLHHLKSLAPYPENLILFVGFQAAGTRGEAMLRGVPQIKIHGEMIPIKAGVASIDSLSAHADADEVMIWLKNFKSPPKMTFIVHGEPIASDTLRMRIQDELRWPCTVPDYQEEWELL
ncbi:MAG TPA: MBL fold metallo-hydrolase [Deltaproteobacteria bacterium]|nr:MAG: mRNA 3'-end processing factor [Deltaproteobacteria bacterium GWA2_45_12]HBF11839.1 MBL fold metallo-hydrolase [Deltaproteobacteria bacterium]